MGNIHAISVSCEKGVPKTNVKSAILEADKGIKGDAHAGVGIRQVSILAKESIDTMVAKGLAVGAGDFAENITTTGLDVPNFKVGDTLKIGDALLKISQIGKTCHSRCSIYYKAGDCVMPREGVFGVVINGGSISVGDDVAHIGSNGLSFGIITLSDKGFAGKRIDETGPTLEEYIDARGASFIRRELLPDDAGLLGKKLVEYADVQRFDVIITNGSTGVAPRDIAPDATMDVIEKRLHGFEDVMRMESYKITKNAIISRAVCGIRNRSIIINLPGSPKAAVENLGFVMTSLQHASNKINGDMTDCALP